MSSLPLTQSSQQSTVNVVLVACSVYFILHTIVPPTSSYVVDVCLAPCLLYAVFWPLLTQFPFLLFPLLGAHAHALYFAVPDLLEYPFSPENVLGVLYWKPARCSVRMLAVTRLVARGLVVLVVVRAAELVLGTAGPPSGTTWEEDQRSFWLRLWSLIAAVVAWGVYYAICVMRRGSDNEWSFLYREMAVLGIAGVLI